ncbi:Crp/Fnr family transcriptional regulator [Pedobacter kyonggii]|nr:Crp/Fnr family transcriptional regulator [Pedobacter kyonggii]
MNLSDMAPVIDPWQSSRTLGVENHSKASEQGNVMKTLFDYIRQYTGIELSLDEQAQLHQAFKYRVVRRRQFLLQEGDLCRYISFVLSGALRMFSVNERGHESVVEFNLEGTWAMDKESISLRQPSRYNIEAIENSHVLQIAAPQLDVLGANIPAIREMVQRQHTENAIATQKRIHAAISMSAEERYHDLLRFNPEFSQRFPQAMLASYLGIKAETLSRLRNRRNGVASINGITNG